MTLIAKINESLISTVILASDVTSYELTESGILSTCRSVNITASNPFWVLKFDGVNCAQGRKLDLYPFFKDAIGLKKCADYIILYFKNNAYHIFLCELKSNNPTGFSSQLDATYILSNVLVNTAKRILNEHPKISTRGVIFTNRIHKAYNHEGRRKETPLSLTYSERLCACPFNLDAHCY